MSDGIPSSTPPWPPWAGYPVWPAPPQLPPPNWSGPGWASSGLMPPRFGGYRQLPRWHFPVGEPGQTLDYLVSLSQGISKGRQLYLWDLVDAGSAIASASVAISPSGPGELTPTEITVPAGGPAAIFWAEGGVAGRDYVAQLIITLATGQVLPIMIYMPISHTLETYPLVMPQSWGFGTPVVWNYVAGLDLSDARNSGLMAAAAGF